MWYKLIVNWSDNTSRTYELKGMTEVMKMLARIKTSNDVVFNKIKVVNYKIEKEED